MKNLATLVCFMDEWCQILLCLYLRWYFKKYIGEVSYYFEEEYREYVLNIIVEAKYRHLGKGKEALELLCKQAKENGLRFLCDDIETNNPAKNLFLDLGFKEVWARENITMLKKRL